MVIKFLIKCHECNNEAEFEYDSNNPYVYAYIPDEHLAVIDLTIIEEGD